MPFNPAEYSPGDPVKAADVNDQNAEIRRLGLARGSEGITVRGGAGSRQYSIELPEAMFVKLTSSAGANGSYSWAEYAHSSPNTWTATGLTGSTSSDPAYEVQTGDATLTAGSTVYEARRACCDAAWLFDGKN